MTTVNRRHVLAGLSSLLVTGRAVAQSGSLPYRMDALCFESASNVEAFRKVLDQNEMDAVVLDMVRYPRTETTAREELKSLSALEAEVESPIRIVRRGTDFGKAKREGRLAVVVASQDASILGHGMTDWRSVLEEFKSLGLRVVQLTHNRRTAFGDSFMERRDGGLSRAGKSLVEAMNSRGMLVDLSHCSELTVYDAAKASTAPVAMTHVGLKEIAPTARNVSSKAVRAVADTGGFIGVFGLTTWLTTDADLDKEHILSHFRTLRNLVGAEHIAFGSDGYLAGSAADKETERMAIVQRNNAGGPSAEWSVHHTRYAPLNGPDRMARLHDLLVGGGFTAAEADQVCGLNVRRVLRTVFAKT